MTKLKQLIKRYAQSGLIILLGGLSAQPSMAQGTTTTDNQSSILQQILTATNSILAQVQTLPGTIQQLFATFQTDPMNMSKSWLTTKDPNAIIATNQPNFTTIYNDYIATVNQQQTFSQGFTQAFLQGPSGNNPMPTNANALNYSVLLGQLLVPPGQNQPAPDMNQISQQYLYNAGGASLAMNPPNPKWASSPASAQYSALYSTTAAIASYNAYILASLNQQQDQNNNRITLLKNATDPNLFFANIQAEDLGLVLRQMLMYTSQLFVDVDRLLAIQQQQLASIAMTNSLLLSLATVTAANNLYATASQAKPS